MVSLEMVSFILSLVAEQSIVAASGCPDTRNRPNSQTSGMVRIAEQFIL
jgi:hypothetical protein